MKTAPRKPRLESRDRIMRLLRRDPADRMGKMEAFWPETMRAWIDAGVTHGQHPNDYFQLDTRRLIRLDDSLQLPVETLSDTGQVVELRNANGVVARQYKHQSAMSEHLAHLIETPDDWQQHRHRLTAHPKRFRFGYYGDYDIHCRTLDPDELASTINRDPSSEQTFLFMYCNDPYEGSVHRLGDAQALMNMAMEPDMIKDMFVTHATMVIDSLTMLIDAGVPVDGLLVGGDVAYRNGMMFSPAMYRELLMPQVQRIIDACHSRDLPLVYHSDGDIRTFLPLLKEMGVDAIHPLEVKAGMRLDEVARDYGDCFTLIGNVAATELELGPDTAEIEMRAKLNQARSARAYIYHSDHSIPPTVSFETFARLMEVFDEQAWYD